MLILGVLSQFLITVFHYFAFVGKLDAFIALIFPPTKLAVLSQIVHHNIFLEFAPASQFDQHFKSTAMLFFKLLNHIAVISVKYHETLRTVVLFAFALEEVLVIVVEQLVDVEDLMLVLGAEVLIVHYPPIIEYLKWF